MDGFYLVLWLFFLYSFAGWFLETGFSILLKKRMINRGVLNGPLCTIYGVTALIISIGFSELRNQWFFLFLGCATISTLVEWCAGHFLEKINHKKWWDYSKMPFNINGRICLLYSIFWGFLGLYLMISVNPKVDRLINYIKSKISTNILQIFVVLCTIFMFVDCVSTAFALSFFTIRTVKEKGIEVKNQAYIDEAYEDIYSNELLVKIINKFFNNEKMLMTFPRLTVEDSNGNIIRVSELYPELRTYYCKFGGEEK